MVTLCQRAAFPEVVPAGPILSADVEVHVGHGTRPPDGGEGHSSRSKPSYTIRPVIRADRSSSFRTKSGKDSMQFKIVLGRNVVSHIGQHSSSRGINLSGKLSA